MAVVHQMLMLIMMVIRCQTVLTNVPAIKQNDDLVFAVAICLMVIMIVMVYMTAKMSALMTFTLTCPGICGCGISNVDRDNYGVVDCKDGCPKDSQKITAGACDCGAPNMDKNNNGSIIPDCNDRIDHDVNHPKKNIMGNESKDDPVNLVAAMMILISSGLALCTTSMVNVTLCWSSWNRFNNHPGLVIHIGSTMHHD